MLPGVAAGWCRGLGGWWGCFSDGGVGGVMRRGTEPCSCRLARSGLRENRQLTSGPGALLRPGGGGSVIVGHLDWRGGNKVRAGRPTTTTAPPSSPLEGPRALSMANT